MIFAIFRRPYRFFLLAAGLALLLCLLPIRAQEAPKEPERIAQEMGETPPVGAAESEVPAGADLSERTQADCALHETLLYIPCGHSVQRRQTLPARLAGLTRGALEAEMESVLPGAVVTGFGAGEVDVTRKIDVPCPLHWVLIGGEDGFLHIRQNRTGEELSLVRRTEVLLEDVLETERQELLDGRMFDDVQALEGYLESVSS